VVKRRLAVLVVSVALGAGIVSLPSVAPAGGRHHYHPGHHQHGGVSVFIGAVPFPHHVGAVIRPFFFPRPVFPYVVYAPPSVGYAPPPVVYLQRPPVAVAPPPNVPSVIHYVTGRYELRGDGVTTPYQWVWIPNPPPPPPAPPEAPPAPLPERAPATPEPEPFVEQQPRAPRGETHHWVDDQGVAHWTDRLDRVPERYRSLTGPRTLSAVGPS
jgi:hypothetical protein